MQIPRIGLLLLTLVVIVLVAYQCEVAHRGLAADDTPPKFETDIVPILEARCVKCHGDGKLEAGFDLRRRFLILKGGDSGAGFVTGKPEESLLIQKIDADEMPPKDEGRLDDKQKALLKRWVVSGAMTIAEKETPLDEGDQPSRLSDEDRKFWAFQTPRRPAVPEVRNLKSETRNQIDAFLLQKLTAKGLSFNAEASKPVLLRRVTFDLLGLPPTIEQLEEFLADESPDAYEKLVDRLLASPKFGERWGRQWLDIAGYADSDGYLAADRLRPEAWRYRDWVVRALNNDLPFDEFVTHQLAGDELTDWRRADEIMPEVAEQLAATGFLRTALDPTYPGYTEPNEIHQVLADTMHIVSSTFLGVTVQCARCHAHKFDPISQRDYYSLQAVFGGALDPARWQPSETRGIPLATEAQEAHIAEHNKKVDERIAALTASLNELTARFRKKHVGQAARLSVIGQPVAVGKEGAGEPPALRNELIYKLIAALLVAADKRNEEQKKLVADFAPDVSVADDELFKRYDEFKEDATKLKAAVAAEQALKKNITRIRGLTDLDEKPAVGHIMRRGDYNKPGAEVTAGVVEVLAPAGFLLTPQASYKTSGRRTALAKWLTSPEHPLLARVHVNRIWAAHFGRGIVPTIANFGRSGAKPSHPELLDWLAMEFANVDESLRDSKTSGHGVTGLRWSQKRLHRLIVTSAAYRQSADTDPAKSAADPDNALLGAWSPKRHQGEMVRDSLLSVSDRLNPRPFGSPTNVALQGDGSVIDTDDEPGRRRSIYQIVRRSQHLTMLELFDTPLMEINCPERTISTVPLQALAMLHGPAADRAAGGLAERLWSAASTDHERIRVAFRVLFTREPSSQEFDNVTHTLAELTQEQLANKPNATGAEKEVAFKAAWRQVALVLLNSNEFVYVH
ncbi:MAG: PSD1 and planctomycete cytochrome C domain-containing protein [Planctomycetia bacterium]|nr:PSD1 and planctomycete cytochrome C domain-containing protein [Planctomycetia bacterium]